MKDTKIYWLQAVTPLHVGAGRGVGFIDMPVMREKVTTWPFVPGSAMKGVMRDHFTQRGNEVQREERYLNAGFGKSSLDEGSNAGALVFTDAHLICFPVRSLYGTFAYATSPLVLERLKKDLIVAGYSNIPDTVWPQDNYACITKKSRVMYNNHIFFEDLDFIAHNDPADVWAAWLSEQIFTTHLSDSLSWREIFNERFVILPDDSFTFLAETGTDVAAHIRIDDETKVVKEGALWYEESLPAEAILAGLVWCDRPYGEFGLSKDQLLACYCGRSLSLQIGGKATVGKGRVVCSFTSGA